MLNHVSKAAPGVASTSNSQTIFIEVYLMEGSMLLCVLCHQPTVLRLYLKANVDKYTNTLGYYFHIF